MQRLDVAWSRFEHESGVVPFCAENSLLGRAEGVTLQWIDDLGSAKGRAYGSDCYAVFVQVALEDIKYSRNVINFYLFDYMLLIYIHTKLVITKEIKFDCLIIAWQKIDRPGNITVYKLNEIFCNG